MKRSNFAFLITFMCGAVAETHFHDESAVLSCAWWVGWAAVAATATAWLIPERWRP